MSESKKPTFLANVATYFDILSNYKLNQERKTMTVPVWLPQWFGLVAGIVTQPYFSAYQNTHQWSLAGFGPWVAASLIIALVVFPGVYKSTVDPEKPWIVQFGAIFSSGLGWNTLFQSAVAAGAGASPTPGH